MVEATANNENDLPETGVTEDTGIKSANLSSGGQRAVELSGKSIELLGAGLEKTSSAIVQPVLDAVLGLEPLTSIAGVGIGGLGKLIGAGGSKLRERAQNHQTINQDNSSNSQTTIQQSGSNSGSQDPTSPLPALTHPDMRRASRMPIVIRNAAMLSNAVQKRMEDQSSDNDETEDQTEALLDAQEESSFRIIDALKEQTSISLEQQEELQPTFLERRQEANRAKKTLEEQQKTNMLLIKGNKQAAKKADDSGGGLLSGIFDKLGGAGGLLGGLLAGLGLGPLLKTIGGLAKRFLPLIGVLSAFDGILAGFEEFKEGGSIGDILMATIEGFTDSLIGIVSGGTLDLEKVQAVVTDGIEWTVNFFSDLWTKITDGIDKAISFLTVGLVDLEDVGNAVSFLFEHIKQGFGIFTDLIKFNFGFIADLLTGNFSGVFDRIQTMFGIFTDGFKWLTDKVLQFFTFGLVDLETVSEAFKGGIDFLKNSLFGLFDQFKLGFGFLKDLVTGNFSGAFDKAKQFFSVYLDAFDWLKEKVTGIFHAVQEKVKGAFSTLTFGLFDSEPETPEERQARIEREGRPANMIEGEKEVDRSIERQGRPANTIDQPSRRLQEDQRERRVSDNIAQSKPAETTKPNIVQSEPQVQESQPNQSQVEVQSLLDGYISETETSNILSVLDKDSMNQQAAEKATQTEELSNQVREAEQASQRLNEQKTLNNMNQVVNAQSYSTNVTKLPPRAEDFNAGVVNRDEDY